MNPMEILNKHDFAIEDMTGLSEAFASPVKTGLDIFDVEENKLIKETINILYHNPHYSKAEDEKYYTIKKLGKKFKNIHSGFGSQLCH